MIAVQSADPANEPPCCSPASAALPFPYALTRPSLTDNAFPDCLCFKCSLLHVFLDNALLSQPTEVMRMVRLVRPCSSSWTFNSTLTLYFSYFPSTIFPLKPGCKRALFVPFTILRTFPLFLICMKPCRNLSRPHLFFLVCRVSFLLLNILFLSKAGSLSHSFT